MKTLIAPEQAMRKAAEQVEELSGERLQFARLQEAAPRAAQLVQRLDDPDDYYYIVSFVASGRETTRMIVNAFDGSLEEASYIEENGEALWKRITPWMWRDNGCGSNSVTMPMPCVSARARARLANIPCSSGNRACSRDRRSCRFINSRWVTRSCITALTASGSMR